PTISFHMARWTTCTSVGHRAPHPPQSVMPYRMRLTKLTILNVENCEFCEKEVAVLPEPNFPIKPGEFIGRRVHLETFTEALRSSARTGRMASFAVMGDWGIGKSSLLLKLATVCSDSASRMLPVTLTVSKDISDYMRFAEALCDRLADALLASHSLETRLRTEIENWKLTRVSLGAVAVDRKSRNYFLSS